MAALSENLIDIAGGQARYLRGGVAGASPVVFLHGGIPGVTPFCSGAHIWDGTLDAFLAERDVIVPDLPGSGGTAWPSGGPVSIMNFVKHVAALLDALDIKSVDLVGHDVGGFIGLVLAMDEPARLRSLSVVASPMSTPQGDQLDDILLRDPPEPLWGRRAQSWALDRLSYAHFHIDEALLADCEAAASGVPHREAVEAMRGDGGAAFMGSLTGAKFRLWAHARDGLAVPTQIVWSSHDPAAHREGGFALYKIIAARQTAAQFHLVNRSGSFPFREQNEAFCHAVAAFQEGVAAESG